MRMMRSPKCWVPSSNAVGGALVRRVSAISPSSVFCPVRHINTLAVPLITDVPRRTVLPAARISGSSGNSTGDFSTGKASPVRRAWLTKKSFASSTRPSQGIRSPAARSATSPGTISASGISKGLPSRNTFPRTATDWRRRSAACPARYSWTKSRVTLIRTMVPMMKKLVASPVKAESPLAARRMMTRGLRNLARNCRISAFLRSLWIRLGPNRASRRAASALLSPSGLAVNCSRSAVAGSCQNGESVLMSGAGIMDSLQNMIGHVCNGQHQNR